MKRRLVILFGLVALVAVAVPGSAAPTTAGAQETVHLRLATLAPRNSAWVRAYARWDRMLSERTDGKLRLRVYPGGSAGDERTVVRKLRANQMDMAAMTTTGLGMIARPVMVLSAPGVIQDYPQLDAVRRELDDELEEQFEDNGFVLLGWGDAGRTRVFSKRPIRRPADLRSARPWVWNDNPIFVQMLRSAGVNGVPLALPEVMAGLQTNRIDTVPATALAAVALQWFTQIEYMSQEGSGVVVGAMVIRKETFDALPEESRRALTETSSENNPRLLRAIRRADDRAYEALVQRGITPVSGERYRSEWEAMARDARNSLAGRLYPRDLLQRVERIAARHR